MSHQTGIKANDDLLRFFGTCRDGRIRAFKVSIINEALSLDGSKESQGTWEEDYDKIVPYYVEDMQPCYVMYRFDSKNNSGYEWLFITWCPDNSPVREKMLYASTKATLKKEFGGGQIKDEFHATGKEDVNFMGFQRHLTAEKAPAPLTMAEEELAEIRRTETGVETGIDTKHQTLQGVMFPLSSTAIQALHDFKLGKCNYLQLSIDTQKEMTNLEYKDMISTNKLSQKVPSDTARYHLFVFEHTHEGDFVSSIVFVYSMPGYNCSIKERMMYSSCKSPLINTIEKFFGIPIDKKIEVDAGEEITEEFLQNELHPKTNLHRPKFAKPKGPPNRGAKRITKPQQQQSGNSCF